MNASHEKLIRLVHNTQALMHNIFVPSFLLFATNENYFKKNMIWDIQWSCDFAFFLHMRLLHTYQFLHTA